MPKNFTATADALAYEDWLEYIDTAGMRGTLDSLSTATYFIPAVDAKKAPPSNSSELLELIQ